MKLLFPLLLVAVPAEAKSPKEEPFVRACKEAHRRILTEEFKQKLDARSEAIIGKSCPEIAAKITAQKGWATFRAPERDGCEAAIIGVFMYPDGKDTDALIEKFCKQYKSWEGK